MNPRTWLSFRANLPGPARLFIVAAEGAAAGLVVFVLSQVASELPAALGLTTIRDVATSAFFFLAIVATGLFPIRLGYRVRTSVTATPIFAAVLIFSPARTVVIVAAAVLIFRLIKCLQSDSLRVQGWLLGDVAFNAAQIMLTAGTSVLLFRALGHESVDLLHLGNTAAVADVGVTLALYFVFNSLIISTISALAAGRTMAGVWHVTFGRTWYLSVSALLLGVGLAIVFRYAPLGALAFVIPLVAIHHAFSSVITVQEQTKRTLETLADALDKRDPYTYEHSQRVAGYARLAVQRLGLDEETQEAVVLAGRVHDLGKIGVREDLLRKPDRLTESEIEEVRRHTAIGAEIVSRLSDYAKSKESILYHHERWDGSGLYRLAYEHIPIGARIIAVADAFDAMTSDRPYRQALSQDEAFAELQKGKGTQFDPAIVDSFIEAIRVKTSTAPTGLFAPPASILPTPRQAQIRH